jgi:hypothetical protein
MFSKKKNTQEVIKETHSKKKKNNVQILLMMMAKCSLLLKMGALKGRTVKNLVIYEVTMGSSRMNFKSNSC